MSEENPTDFPLRLGAIDVGSNALRLVVREYADRDHSQRLAKERAAIRLGSEVFRSGRLDPEDVDAAVAALRGFGEQLASLGVERYRAVATSALREAADGAEFALRVRDEAGVELEVIDGAEEARLVSLAVADVLPIGAGRWVLADLGGGSVEVSLIETGEITWTVSHRMGSVRLLAALDAAADCTARMRDLLDEYRTELRLERRLQGKPVRGFVAVGGNIEELARLFGSRSAETGGARTVSLAALARGIEELADLSVQERMAGYKLRADRADVIVPAARVYELLAQEVGADSILVPDVGVRDGILLDLLSPPAAWEVRR